MSDQTLSLTNDRLIRKIINCSLGSILTSSFPQELTLQVLLPVSMPVLVDHVLDSDSPLTMLGVVSVVGDD